MNKIVMIALLACLSLGACSVHRTTGVARQPDRSGSMDDSFNMRWTEMGRAKESWAN